MPRHVIHLPTEIIETEANFASSVGQGSNKRLVAVTRWQPSTNMTEVIYRVTNHGTYVDVGDFKSAIELYNSFD